MRKRNVTCNAQILQNVFSKHIDLIVALSWQTDRSNIFFRNISCRLQLQQRDVVDLFSVVVLRMFDPILDLDVLHRVKALVLRVAVFLGVDVVLSQTNVYSEISHDSDKTLDHKISLTILV